MKLPFSTDQFFAVLAKYNDSVFPFQFVFILLAVLVMNQARKGNSDGWVTNFLAFLWIWMGVVYHLRFFTSINPAAYVFGIAFILQGILFFYMQLTGKISYGFQSTVKGITGAIFITYALIVYPLLGMLLGQHYPEFPTFGLPCPTTIFTFGLLLWTSRVPKSIWIIPFLWVIVGTSAAFYLDIKEDFGLAISGIIMLGILATERKPGVKAIA